MFEELEIVELTHDIKEHKLKEGNTGTVVLVYREGKAYEVEFVNAEGKTTALLTLLPSDIRARKSNEIFDSPRTVKGLRGYFISGLGTINVTGNKSIEDQSNIEISISTAGASSEFSYRHQGI